MLVEQGSGVLISYVDDYPVVALALNVRHQYSEAQTYFPRQELKV